jgi:hypothetical protein
MTPCAISTTGHLMVMDGEKDLASMGRLTLVLDDGRKWVFIFIRSAFQIGKNEFSTQLPFLD